MELTTAQKGQLAMLKVAQRAIEKNAILSLPTLEGCRYDAILDWNDKIYRVQVKYSNCYRRDNVLQVKAARKIGSETHNVRIAYTKDEIDIMLIYSPIIDNILWISPEIFHNKSTINVYLDNNNVNSKNPIFAQDIIW